MRDEIILGQMICPNCGNIVSTIPNINCICGYNFQTDKVEESPLVKAIKEINLEVEPLELSSINKI